jgi:hypothetical protein
MGTLNTSRLAEGVYPLEISETRSFGPNACMIEEMSLRQLVVNAKFEMEIIRPAVRSHYEVATRGRVIKLATSKVHDIGIDLSVIEIGNCRIGDQLRVDIRRRAPSEKPHWIQAEIIRRKNVSIVLVGVEQE